MYYIVFGICYVVSLLPFTALYLLSDFLYVIIYYIARYRRQVVSKNLEMAFPEKTAAEREAIARQFYRCFCDNWLETLKLLSISRKGLLRRVSGNMEALEEIYRSGKSCHVLMGHQFNWEWGNAFVMAKEPFPLLAAYSPLSSRVFNRLLLYLRGRFGTVLLPFNDMRRGMLSYRNQPYALALMADQSPPGPDKSYWVPFLHTPTAFLKGPEKGARRGNMPVVWVGFSRPRRGYYRLEAQLLAADAGQLPEAELTRRYAQALETAIRNNPPLYLWSHNRWKHAWKPEYGLKE